MYFPLLANYLPPIFHLTASESHRNLIGTSPNNYRAFSVLSWADDRLFFIALYSSRLM